MSIHPLLLMSLLFMSLFLNAKKHRLDTRVSNIVELKSGEYPCVFDDEKNEAECYKSSLTDPTDVQQIIFGQQDGVHVVCGYGEGEDLIGAYDKEDLKNEDSEELSPDKGNDSDHICSVWTRAKKESGAK